MPEFMVDAWFDGKVTLTYRDDERYLIFKFSANDATKIGMLLLDRARIARSGEETEGEGEEDATE